MSSTVHGQTGENVNAVSQDAATHPTVEDGQPRGGACNDQHANNSDCCAGNTTSIGAPKHEYACLHDPSSLACMAALKDLPSSQSVACCTIAHAVAIGAAPYYARRHRHEPMDGHCG
eukprot:6203347-Pleurochrysis_carterae.AAC.4